MEREVFISAGEVSGDQHGAALLRSLRCDVPGLAAAGIGGAELAGEGMELIAGIEELSLVGVAEVVPRLGSILKLIGKVRRHLAARRPSAVVLIDSPDFNLRVAAIAKKLGLRVVYYIGPTIWAWRRGRLHTVRRHVDLMLTILPFEEALYTSQGIRARFVGHPLAGLSVPLGQVAALRATLGLSDNDTIVALLPGSRKNEIRRHVPILLDTARLLLKRHDRLHFLVPAASAEAAASIHALLGTPTPSLTVVEGKARTCLAASRAALVASGTATLEAALIGTPFAAFYRLSPLSYAIGRLMIDTPFISLPNILAGKEVVREFIQAGFQADVLADAAEKLLFDEESRRVMRGHFDMIKSELPRGADEAAGRAVAAELRRVGSSGNQPSP